MSVLTYNSAGVPICPILPISMAAGLRKTPRFNTVKQTTAAGTVSAISLMPYPCWDFELSLDFIKGHERFGVVSQFLGLYLATAGGANPFLFVDPQDNKVTGAQFGIGNGTATAFQLSRNLFGSVDIIQNAIGVTVLANGTPAPCTFSPTGVVSFGTAPANGAILTWSGQFGYMCRFAEDTLDSTRVFTVNNGIDYWNISGIKFSSEFVFSNTFGLIAAHGGV